MDKRVFAGYYPAHWFSGGLDMFNLFSFGGQDLSNVKKLQESKVRSRKVIGRGTLVSDASEIRKTETFKKYAEKASELVAAE